MVIKGDDLVEIRVPASTQLRYLVQCTTLTNTEGTEECFLMEGTRVRVLRR